MNRALFLLLAACVMGPSAPLAAAENADGLALVPAPVKVELRDGCFELTPQTIVVADSGADVEAERLAAELRRPTGFALTVRKDATADGCIVLTRDQTLEARLGREGYRLSVTPKQVSIRAAGDAGLFYGGITLRQLLPPAFCRPSRTGRPAVGAAGAAMAGAFLAYPEGLAKPLIIVIELALLPSLAVTLALMVAGAPQRAEP